MALTYRFNAVPGKLADIKSVCLEGVFNLRVGTKTSFGAFFK